MDYPTGKISILFVRPPCQCAYYIFKPHQRPYEFWPIFFLVLDPVPRSLIHISPHPQPCPSQRRISFKIPSSSSETPTSSSPGKSLTLLLRAVMRASVCAGEGSSVSRGSWPRRWMSLAFHVRAVSAVWL